MLDRLSPTLRGSEHYAWSAAEYCEETKSFKYQVDVEINDPMVDVMTNTW